MKPSYKKSEFLINKLISIFDRARYVPNTGASTLKVIQILLKMLQIKLEWAVKKLNAPCKGKADSWET